MNKMPGMKFIGAALFSSPASVVAIELSSASLRVVHTVLRGRNKEVVDSSIFDVNGLDDSQIADTIRNFLSKNKIRNLKTVLTIPSHLVITKNIEVPSQDPAEIADIMNLQAARHTPYAREEIIIDYTTIGVYRKSYTKILLVIVKKEVVRKQLEIIKKAGLEVNKICLASEAVARFASSIVKLHDDDFPVGTLHIDSAFSYFSIVWKKDSIFARSIPIGTQQLSEEYNRYCGKFVEEIKKSIEAYKSEDIESTPQMIVLLEHDYDFKGLEPLLCEATGLPTERGSCLENMFLKDEVKKDIIAAKAAFLLNVISTSFESDDLNVDLMPEEIKLKKLFEQKSRDIIKTGVFSLAIFILIFALLTSKISFKSLYLDRLKERSALIHRDAEELENKFSHVQLVKRYMALRGYSLKILDTIYENIPDNMRLVEVRFDRVKKSLLIKGVADSMRAIYSFLDSLSKVSYFKDVVRESTTSRKEDEKDVEDFVLAIKLFDKPGQR